MKKVTIFVGSAHRRNTHAAAVQFREKLQKQGPVEVEIVTLSDYRLGICRGCRVCFEKGEGFCPLRDDRDVLMEKIAASDGIVFATPNYSFQVSGLLKIFLDRFGFAFHRPRFYGKAFTSIVTQGFGAGDKIIAYLDFFAKGLAFNTLKGITVTGFDPKTDREQRRIERDLNRLAQNYFALLAGPVDPTPSLFQLLMFRMGRTTIRQKASPDSLDYRYFVERGWLDADYYYPTRLNPFQRAAGRLFDRLTATMREMMA